MGTSYFGIELKACYFNEFIVCGVPIPPYTTEQGFVLKFNTPDGFISYTNVLKTILSELELADPESVKYDVQRSRAFIKNILFIMRDQFSKRYN